MENDDSSSQPGSSSSRKRKPEDSADSGASSQEASSPPTKKRKVKASPGSKKSSVPAKGAGVGSIPAPTDEEESAEFSEIRKQISTGQYYERELSREYSETQEKWKVASGKLDRARSDHQSSCDLMEKLKKMLQSTQIRIASTKKELSLAEEGEVRARFEKEEYLYLWKEEVRLFNNRIEDAIELGVSNLPDPIEFNDREGAESGVGADSAGAGAGSAES